MDPPAFHQSGHCVARGLCDEASLRAAEVLTERWAAERTPPFELEAEVGYPGAPDPADSGGGTVRRFLQVFQRDELFRALLVQSGVVDAVGELLGAPPILVLAHHNCLMTKEPAHSSDTPWHRDLRYWSFTEGELVTAWIALGSERPARGGLLVVPGSHRRELPESAFDEQDAIRLDRAEGKSAVDGAVPVILERGDVLFFHCRLLHSAARNQEASSKRSLVFTFRRPSDRPLAGTRSALRGEVRFDGAGDR